MEPLFRLVTRQLAALQKLPVYIGEVMRAATSQFVKNMAVEHSQSVVDVAHSRRRMHLVVLHNTALVKLHIASVSVTGVMKNRHQSPLSRLREPALHCHVITGQIGIAIKNEERRP